jgi:hypothetical protein
VLNSKVYIIRDLFHTVSSAVLKDPLVSSATRGMSRKIFKLFFRHLKTAISQMALYLVTIPTARDIPVNLSAFDALVKAMRKATEATSSKSKKGKDKAVDVEDAMVATSELLEVVGWSHDKFFYSYRKLLSFMNSNYPFKSEHRLNPDLGTVLVTTSGLTWNPDSQNKVRDYNNIAIVATLETAIIPAYRKDLLRHCVLACAMRRDMHETMTDCASPSRRQTADRVMSKVWFFPDGIPPEFEEDAGLSDGSKEMIHPDTMYADVEQVHLADAKKKKDTVTNLIMGLLKNSLLLCREPGVAPGTVESSAYHHIVGLHQARMSTFLRSLLTVPCFIDTKDKPGSTRAREGRQRRTLRHLRLQASRVSLEAACRYEGR